MAFCSFFPSGKLIQTRAIFGFRFQTAYLSMTYFDRFLSSRSIDVRYFYFKSVAKFQFNTWFLLLISFIIFLQSEKSWAVKLLSVACLSLAAKMEEVKTPALSEFQMEECNFESKIIQRMELLVLNTLQWRMLSITPFSFIQYFIIRFCKESPPRHVVSKTARFILAVVRGFF